jgi:hypothetical protein
VTCATRRPHASNTHLETSPRLQAQREKVALLWDRVNGCILDPVEAGTH